MNPRGLLFAALIAFSAPAAAAIWPCAVSGVTWFSPAHPGPDDPIVFRVALHFVHMSATTVARADVQSRRIHIDVVNTGRPASFPDYRIVSRNYDDIFAQVPPLPPGSYDVRVVVRNDSEGDLNTCTNDSALVVGLVPGPTQVLPVVEFHHATLDHYFVTRDGREIADLDSGVHAGWTRTGGTFDAYATGASDGRGSGTCRWYGILDGAIGTHFLAASTTECSAAGRDAPPGWIWVEETRNAFEIPLPDLPTGTCASGTTPVYRLWNNRVDSNHRYTTDIAIKQQMIARGWIPEGFGPDNVAMCAPVPQAD